MKIHLGRFDNKFTNVWKMFILLLSLSFVISLIASIILAVYSYRPIDKLLDFVKHPGTSGHSQFRTEEIKEIASNLLTTVNINKHLKKELVSKLSLIEKTRITALQAQINPHFLYNSLDAIRWTAMEHIGGENKISDMITSLARLLRLSLETQDNMVSVKEEVEHARLFCRLLETRYTGKFKVVWNIEADIENCSILKLCLQPLIENACYHGIKPTRKQGIITIEGKKEHNQLHFRVRDNGKGLSPEEIEFLNKSITEDLDINDNHIGLKNVNQRIKLVFGEKWGLTISSGEKNGTSVDLYFPYMISL